MQNPGYLALYNPFSVVGAAALDATGVKLRFPIVDTVNAYEFGVRVVGSTAPGTGLVVKAQYEPIAGAAAVDIATATCTAAVTQGKALVRRFDAMLDKDDVFISGTKTAGANPAFIVLNVTGAGAGGSTGIPYLKVRNGGSGGADANEVVVTS